MMAIYNGKKAAHEYLLDIAKQCAQGALKSPQITGRLNLQIEILTGEREIIPIVEMFEIQAEIRPASMRTALGYRKLFETGETPVILLLGADLTVSEMGWNCGACGFSTCAEFNKYARENRAFGRGMQGPSCNWKILDFGVAISWASAAAWQCNVENRLSMFEGGFALRLGYLEGCSCAMSLPLVSSKELFFYSRETKETFSYEWWKDYIRNIIPNTFMPFVSPTTIPYIKTRQDWEQDMASPKWVIPKEDADIARKQIEVGKRLAEFAAKKRPEILAMRKEALGEKGSSTK